MLKQPGVSVDDAVSFHFQVATERSRRKKKQRQDVFIVPKDLLNDFTYRAEDVHVLGWCLMADPSRLWVSVRHTFCETCTAGTSSLL